MRYPANPQPAGIPMIRFLLRFLGLFLLATAFVFFVYDGTKSIANQQFVYVRVSELWADIDQHSLNTVQDWLKQKALWAWDPYVQSIFRSAHLARACRNIDDPGYARPQEEETHRLRAGLSATRLATRE